MTFAYQSQPSQAYQQAVHHYEDSYDSVSFYLFFDFTRSFIFLISDVFRSAIILIC